MAKKLTRPQRQMLENVRDGKDPFYGCFGNSQWGGRTRTWESIERRGYVSKVGPGHNDFELTDAGREALASIN